MKLRNKLILIFVFLSTVPMVTVFGLVYVKAKNTIENRAFHHLEAVNLYKSSEIDRWLTDAENSLKALGQRPLVVEYTKALARHHQPAFSDMDSKVKLVKNHFQIRVDLGRFREIFVLCPLHGEILASTDHRQEGKFRNTRPYFLNGRENTYIQELFYSVSLEQPTMVVSTPVKDGKGNLAAVLAGRLDLSELSEIISQGWRLQATEDTYLVNTFNFFITEPRFGDDYALKKTVHTKGVNACLSGKDGKAFYNDYRNVPVLGVYHWLEKYQAAILTETDRQDAYEPIGRMARWTVFFLITAVLITSGLGVLFATSISRPIRQLVVGTREVSRGNLAHRLEHLSQDEIGDLSRAFDSMTETIQKTTVSRDEYRQLNKELEHRVAERTEELKNQAAFQTSIMQHSPIGIVVYHENGQCIQANTTAAGMIGAGIEEVLNQNFRTIPSWKHSGLLVCAEKCLSSGEKQRTSVSVMSSFGRQVVLDCLFATFTIQHEKHLLLLFNDITELTQKEKDLKHKTMQLKAANKELESFSYSVSHDLRAPLRAVNGYTRMLEEDYEQILDAEGRRILGVIRSEAVRLGNLIDDLLTYSRLGRSRMEYSRIDMETLAQSIFHELASPDDKERIQFHVKEIPQATADPTLIRQVWSNLIDNAIKYSANKNPAMIEVDGETAEYEYIYSITDNGAGFDMQYVDKLFGIFQRLHSDKEFKGSGVGLANVQRVILRHGGRIWARGEPGKGAVIFFSLPSVHKSDVVKTETDKENTDER